MKGDYPSMQYDDKQLTNLLTSDVISALLKIYALKYEHIAVRLGITRQGIVYKQKTNAWRDYEKQMVLELLRQHGCDDTFIILIHTILTAKKKVK